MKVYNHQYPIESEKFNFLPRPKKKIGYWARTRQNPDESPNIALVFQY